jgi:hypothetical protein
MYDGRRRKRHPRPSLMSSQSRWLLRLGIPYLARQATLYFKTTHVWTKDTLQDVFMMELAVRWKLNFVIQKKETRPALAGIWRFRLVYTDRILNAGTFVEVRVHVEEDTVGISKAISTVGCNATVFTADLFSKLFWQCRISNDIYTINKDL